MQSWRVVISLEQATRRARCGLCSRPLTENLGRGRDDLTKITDFRFHDLRHTFASWYMMNGGDLYELAKILGHSNIKMTERYAKLARSHIARTGNTAREMWTLLKAADGEPRTGTR